MYIAVYLLIYFLICIIVLLLSIDAHADHNLMLYVSVKLKKKKNLKNNCYELNIIFIITTIIILLDITSSKNTSIIYTVVFAKNNI